MNETPEAVAGGRVRSALRRNGLGPIEGVLIAGAVVGGIVLRFLPRGPMWLDEALSVNIARLPVGSIGGALRHDGHPPLYYVLLHYWMDVGGWFGRANSNTWIRALSGVVSVATFPLAALAGSRLGGRRAGAWTLAMFAALPFAVRYGSEARMYALAMAISFGLIISVFDLLVPGPTRDRNKAPATTALLLGVCTSAALWTHYWFFWVLGAVGGLLLLVAVRRPLLRGRAVLGLAAMGIGGITFVPWLGALAYQSAHTGTPWGKTFRPATMAVVSLVDFSGGPVGEPQVLSYVLAFLVLVAVAGWSTAGSIRLSRPGWNPLTTMATTAVGALSLGWLASVATDGTFASRYSSVVFPVFVVLTAVGLTRIPGSKLAPVTAAVVLAGCLVGVGLELTKGRTQAAEAGAAITAARLVDPIVVTCPDQLSVGLLRELPRGTPVWTYPRFENPRFVDWVDYSDRNAAADPEAFAAEVLRRAGDRPLVLVTNFTYLTLERPCATVASVLQSARHGVTVLPGSPDFYESMSVVVLTAGKG